MKTKLFLWVVVVFAVIGAINAGFIYHKTGNGKPIPCFVVQGCDQVQNSTYSKLLGIPLSLLGIIYYVLLALYATYSSLSSRESNFKSLVFRLLFVYIGFGLLFSLYLLYLQVFVIEAFCSSCLLSLADMIVITACGGAILKEYLILKTKN